MLLNFGFWNIIFAPSRALIPIMTSNASPSGKSSDTVNNSTAFNAFNSTGFSAGNNTLTYIFSSLHSITSWTIGYGSYGNWASIVLQGSINGITWTTLGTLTTGNSSAVVQNYNKFYQFRFVFNVTSMSNFSTQLYGY